MYYHNLFTSLASSYSYNSLWVLPPSNKQFMWVDFCGDSLRAAFDSGANPEGDDYNRETYWQAAYTALERIENIMASSELERIENIMISAEPELR